MGGEGVEIKVRCPQCGKEVRVLLHVVDKLKAENQDLRRQLHSKNSGGDMPDFFKDLFK